MSTIPKSVTILQSPATPLERALNEYNLRQTFHDPDRLVAVMNAVREEEQQKATVFWTSRCADVAQVVAHENEGSVIECERDGLSESTIHWYLRAAGVARRIESSIRNLGYKMTAEKKTAV